MRRLHADTQGRQRGVAAGKDTKTRASDDKADGENLCTEAGMGAGRVAESDEKCPAADAMQQAFFQVRVDVASKDPRKAREHLVATAAAKVRRHPTVPADPDDATQPWQAALAEDMAVELPAAHCAFAGCTWQTDTADEVYEHVLQKHGDIVLPIAEMVHPSNEDEMLRVAAAYHEIVAHAIRDGAPLSAYSLHRRSLKMYAHATQQKNIASPICFMCACTFPWVRGRRGNEISWEQPFRAMEKDSSTVSHFGTWTMSEVKMRFSVAAYLRDYRGEPGNSALDLQSDAWEGKDFDDWFVTIPTAGGEVRVLCCPEDQVCKRRCEERGTACPECSVPLCTECKEEVERPRQWRTAAVPPVPRRSLANDLMAFYAPDRMYTEDMTVMEMICCSPCITSMICFSLEVKFHSAEETGKSRESLFDSVAGFHIGRLAARGNATSFMLPWQGILQ